MGNTVKFDKRKSDDLKELKRRQAEFDKVSYEYNQHLNRFCLIGENSKGGTSYEKAVDDVIECMGALSIAGHAVKEQREKMGLRTKPKSHDGSTEAAQRIAWMIWRTVRTDFCGETILKTMTASQINNDDKYVAERKIM